MEKLCALKEIVPGSVVELPEELGKGQAVVLGLEYQTDKKSIAAFVAREGTFSFTALPIYSDDKQLLVKDNDPLKAAVMSAFLKGLIYLPNWQPVSGSDPEIFVEHGDGSIFPAWEFLPSEAEADVLAKQWLLTHYESGGGTWPGAYWGIPDNVFCPRKTKVYWDGVQAEMAPWAKTCLEAHHCATREGLKQILAAARAKDPNAKLTLRNVVELPDTLLKSAESKHIKFRCSESYNIYDDQPEGIADARAYKYRASGGHVHLGNPRGFTAPGIEQAIRGFDAVLGVAGVSLAAGIDNPERRRTYGRAGEFRLPAHGIEYRVLSNFWLCHPAIAHLVFDLARVTLRFSQSGFYSIGWLAPEEETREIINNCDVAGAQRILNRNAGVLKHLFVQSWKSKDEAMAKLAVSTVLNGVGSVVKDPFDIETNWKINNPDLWRDHCRGADNSWYFLTQRKADEGIPTRQ